MNRVLYKGAELSIASLVEWFKTVTFRKVLMMNFINMGTKLLENFVFVHLFLQQEALRKDVTTDALGERFKTMTLRMSY